jgi:hypothetical protein
VYARRSLPLDENELGVIYARQITRDRISEGVLECEPLLPIERYLEPADSSDSQPADDHRPRAKLSWGMPIFFDLDKASDPIPAVLDELNKTGTETGIAYFDALGRRVSDGKLTHEVEIEGIEDVTCPAGHFPRCMRVRIRLNVRFPWIFVVDLTSYIWLSPEVGEVRRVQRLSGWFVIFPFGTTREYRLISYDLPQASQDRQPLPPPRWARGVLVFGGMYPHPEIAGMVIDLATSQPGP